MMPNKASSKKSVPTKSKKTKTTQPKTQNTTEPNGNADNNAKNKAVEKQIKLALGAKMLAASFGEMVGILMSSSIHKHYSLADLEWLLVPAFLNNQFTVAEARKKDSAIASPVGVALWAKVSAEVDEKLTANLDKPLRMRPDEWNSGEILWLIDVVGSSKIMQAMIAQLQKTTFKGKDFKMRVIDKNRNVSVKTVKAGSEKTRNEAQ